MVLIECFDEDCIENIVACLRLRPQKVIFLGDGAAMEAPLGQLRKILSGRGLPTKVMPYHVRRDRMDDITMVLRNILRGDDRFVIDITGGSEALLLAVGMVLGEMEPSRRQKIEVQKFDPVSGKIMDADGNGSILPGEEAALTVAELITLHGGVIHPDTHQPGQHYRPEDVEPLWKAMCANRKDWNKAVMALNEFESRCDSKTDIALSLQHLRTAVSRFEEKLCLVRWLLAELSRCAVIHDRSTADDLRYTYLDPLLRSCAQKAGNLLEIKVLLESRTLKNEGKPYFTDCQMGVSIDWDGVVYPPSQRLPETRNEIDGILMSGMVPLFVSCKNGDIGDDELYKLHTVAHRFGGIYARKLLIATELDRKGPTANRAFLQRAEDMGIHVIEDAAYLTHAGWQQALRAAMEK